MKRFFFNLFFSVAVLPTIFGLYILLCWFFGWKIWAKIQWADPNPIFASIFLLIGIIWAFKMQKFDNK